MYTPQTWVNGPAGGTPISATRLGVMETGIAQAHHGLNLRSFGAVGDGVTDDTAAIQAAFTAVKFNGLGDSRTRMLFCPAGLYKFTTTLTLGQGAYICGEGGHDWGTEFWYYGADATNAFSAGVGSPGTSMVYFKDLRVVDKRTTPTSGSGIHCNNVDNRVLMENLQVHGFPTNQIYVGAPSGQASDCVTIRNVWVNSTKTGAVGILLERLDNNIKIEDIYSDLSGGGAVIRIQSMAHDNTAIAIDGVKHESIDDLTTTIHVPLSNKGNLSIKNVVQRTPGTAGYDIITLTESTAGRCTFENILGDNHNTWGSGPCIINCVDVGVKVWEAVGRAQLAKSSGRVARTVVGNGVPNSATYGNVGDIYQRTDGGANTTFYVKESGNATNTGWVAK